MSSNENVDIEKLKFRIDEQANLVRKLKSDPNHNKVCWRRIRFFNYYLFSSRMKLQQLYKNY